MVQVLWDILWFFSDVNLSTKCMYALLTKNLFLIHKKSEGLILIKTCFTGTSMAKELVIPFRQRTVQCLYVTNFGHNRFFLQWIVLVPLYKLSFRFGSTNSSQIVSMYEVMFDFRSNQHKSEQGLTGLFLLSVCIFLSKNAYMRRDSS